MQGASGSSSTRLASSSSFPEIIPQDKTTHELKTVALS